MEDTNCKDHGACPSVAMDKLAIANELSSLAAWDFVTDPDRISCEFKFSDFKEALEFTNKVAKIAEEMNHHPDILLKWGSVRVDYWTHNAHGLTKLDFEAAKKINRLT